MISIKLQGVLTMLTIKEAVIRSLEILGRPSKVSEIYNTILKNNFYVFTEENPKSTLMVELLKSCAEVHVNNPTVGKSFYKEGPLTFGLLSWLKRNANPTVIIKEEEQKVLNEKLNKIEESIELLKTRQTYSYETATKKQEKISKYAKAKDKPYFGRVDIQEHGQTDILYIGENGIEYDDSEIIVVDWRADISQLYYSFHGGRNKLSYDSNGQFFDVIIQRKRQIMIENQKVQNVVETLGAGSKPVKSTADQSQEQENKELSLLYPDEFINQILSQTNETHSLRNIIASIQIEQDEIIRQGMDKHIIVQGASGSGKSSIALHRISYLLYKYKDKLRPNNILILAPNKMFISFIQESLPHLDIKSIRQSTFIEWAKGQLKDTKAKIQEPYESLLTYINQQFQGIEEFQKVSSFKGSISMKKIINRYLQEIEFQLLPKEKKITINSDDFLDTQKIYSAYKMKSHLPLNQRISDVRKLIEAELSDSERKSRDKITSEFDLIYEKWISELPEGSPERKVFFDQVDQLKAKKLKRTSSQHLAVKQRLFQTLKPFTTLGIYKNLFNKDLLQALEPDLEAEFIYEFVKSSLNEKYIPAEDLAPILYIETKINGVKDKFDYLIVDEAQDLSPLEVEILKTYCNSMTLLGDITQSIYSYKSIINWEELFPSVFTGEEVKRMNLEVSYRSTYEIMNIANTIIENSSLRLPTVTPVKRNGDQPVFTQVENGKELFENIRESISLFREKGYHNIGIIGKDLEQTKLFYEYLVKFGEQSVQLVIDSNQTLTAEVIVIPSYLVKGLEFDAVIIPNAGKDRFQDNPIDTKLLYVCVTRAHHDLHIFYHGELSPLLEKKKRLVEN